MTINVTSVNDAPAGADNTVTATEDTDYVFDTADFGFTDPNDNPDDSFASVIITSHGHPTAPCILDADGDGVVDGGEALNDTDTVSGGRHQRGSFEVQAGGLMPTANSYDSFTFQVVDDGGGADTDLQANTMTINVMLGGRCPGR